MLSQEKVIETKYMYDKFNCIISTIEIFFPVRVLLFL